MKRMIGLLTLVASATVAAATALTATWVAPTMNVDGSTISGAVTYNVYSGAKGAEVKTASGLTTTTAQIAGTAGTALCVQVTALVNSQESARTPEVCGTPAFPVPQAPTGLTLGGVPAMAKVR